MSNEPRKGGWAESWPVILTMLALTALVVYLRLSGKIQ